MNTGAVVAQPFGAGHNSLPGNAFTHLAERLLLRTCSLLARFWPLLVGVVYLDCAWALLEERDSYHFGQIGWHLAAIALANVLAILGHMGGESLSLHAPAAQARVRAELCLGICLLPLLLGLSVLAAVFAGSRPLPLELLVRLAAAVCSLVLSLALMARMGCLLNLSRHPGG